MSLCNKIVGEGFLAHFFIGMSTMRKKKSHEKHAEKMSEKEKIQYGRHHNLDNLKTVIFIELIQINACVIV